MLDLKSGRRAKIKRNRLLEEREPRDWKKIFHRALRLAVFSFSAILVVAGGTLSAQVILDSGYFHISSIRVENAARVGEEEIVALSDIRLGSSIFSLDLAMIGAKIEENPWIAQAAVERLFPSEVVIRVRERVPKAIINLGYLYYVDGEGEVFKVLGGGDRLDFPVITGLDRTEMLQDPEPPRRKLREAMALLLELEGREVFNLAQVSEIHIDEVEGFRLYTNRGGVPVRFGHRGFRQKLDRLERIYPELEPSLQALKYIDLNVADRIIVKLDNRRRTGRG